MWCLSPPVFAASRRGPPRSFGPESRLAEAEDEGGRSQRRMVARGRKAEDTRRRKGQPEYRISRITRISILGRLDYEVEFYCLVFGPPRASKSKRNLGIRDDRPPLVFDAD